MIKKYFKKVATIVSTLLLVFTLTFSSVTPAFAPQKAEAILGVGDTVTEIGANLWTNLKNTFESTIQTVRQASLVLKDFELDAVAWALINKMVERMLQDMTDWIASGFEGKPGFVENFKATTLDVADKYALEFIWDNNLVDLCSPFKLDIQNALTMMYSKDNGEYYAGCRLSDVFSGGVGQLEALANGDFIAGGGWPAWFEMNANPQLSTTESFFEARWAVGAGITNAKGQSLFDFNLGDGFKGVRHCFDIKSEDGTKTQERCDYVTPGEAVKANVEEVLGVPYGRLTVADEINELIGTFIETMGRELLGSAGGLLGGGSSKTDKSDGFFYNKANPAAGEYTDYSSHTDEEAIAAKAQASNEAFYNNLASSTANGTGPNSGVNTGNGTNGGIGALSTTETEYLELLQEAAVMIQSCEDTNLTMQDRNLLTNATKNINSDMSSILSGTGSISNSDISTYKYSTLRDIAEVSVKCN